MEHDYIYSGIMDGEEFFGHWNGQILGMSLFMSSCVNPRRAEIVKDRFEIFFNLAQSSDITNYQDGTNGVLIQTSSLSKFTDRITFVFDLNNLTPSKLKKQLKLF